MAIPLKPLKDQVIVITGASSGIGLVTARTAAARGARVMLVARSEGALSDAVDAIRAGGGTADYHVADMGDADAVKAAAAQAVARFGRIDTWVNNAGVAIYAKLMETPADEHRQLFRTNYFGMVHGCEAAVPLLAAGGALITVGSIASDMSSPVMGAYSASKHAVQAYVQALRMELRAAGSPISVSLVKPAGIDTPIGQHAANHEGGEAQIPPPAYDPQLVADAILDCAVHPRREITVGGAGRAQAMFAVHFPALFERLAPRAAKSFVDRDKTQPRPSNLFEGVHAGHERSGEQAPLKSSAYTAVMLRPGAALAVGGGLAAGVAALLLARRRARG
ncbi:MULTISPECIES: SDR family oxidoreductase [unclassified Sphingomonas]|uniref:SDR family oxidoreductase n=1 Tax=unclassified Sphingomonas TaxID=196159 RepID=UPI0022698A78|nr:MULTISPECIES: SDR family oxidoreductase [unclassified Sphingomonas]